MSITDTGDTPKLTPKQEAFVHAYLETSNATEAYRRAYDAENMAEATINVKASELLKNGKVSVRLHELQERASAKVVLSRAWVLERLMRNADAAVGKEDFQASNKALELLGKTDELGMFTEKTKNETVVTGNMTMTTVDRPERETREEWIARRKRELAVAQSVGTATGSAN